jgi:hypothetical protein
MKVLGIGFFPRRGGGAERAEKDEVSLRPLLLCLSADKERGDQATIPDKAMATQHGCFFTHSLNHFFPRRSALLRALAFHRLTSRSSSFVPLCLCERLKCFSHEGTKTDGGNGRGQKGRDALFTSSQAGRAMLRGNGVRSLFVARF